MQDETEAVMADELTQDTELQVLLRGVEKTTVNLFKMSAMIRKGNTNQDRLSKASKINISHYEPYDLRHVKDKYPNANERLIERMAKAISRRRQYLKYREQHHEKLAKMVTDSSPAPLYELPEDRQPMRELIPRSTISTNPASKEPMKENASESFSIVQSTNTSTFVPSKIPKLIDLDVDVYSEADTQTSYASSLAGEEKLRVPPPPEPSRNGQDFECPYCYKICRLNGTQEWQRRKEWRSESANTIQLFVRTI